MSFNFMAAVIICSDFKAQENKICHCFHCFPILPWSAGTRYHDLIFWMLSFKPTFSLSSFTVINRLLSSSSLSAIRVVSSAYLRSLIFLPAILIPACASSSLAFHMMYSAYKLNDQGDNIQHWCTPLQIWSQSVVPCPVLTVASWPEYRFLRQQVRWSGIPISWRILQFVVIHTVKGFSVLNKAKVDVFLELSCFFYDPLDVGNLISSSSAFSKSSLNIWKFMVHIPLKPGLENFKHDFIVWDACNCAVLWALFGIPFLWEFSIVCCDSHKDFSIVNDTEVDVFLEFSCFFYDPVDVGNLISGSLTFLNPAGTSGRSWFTYCWSLAWRILSVTLLA